MQELKDKIDEISSIKEHYLVKAKTAGHTYLVEFLKAAEILKALLSKKEYEFWLTEKMLLKKAPFAEKTFVQYAVETAVVSFFGDRFPKDFKVEAKINAENDKDVDCQFKDGECVFNIEVKCSDFKSKEKIDNKDGFKYETIGRLPDRGQEAIDVLSAALDEGMNKQGEPAKPHLVSKKMDNNLWEFLVLAHNKFSSISKENEVNVLVVGCDDDRDIQNWINYMVAEQGLFTSRSFAPVEGYKNVDLVVLTNQYFKHNKYFNKSVRNSWTLDKGFNLIFCNPFRQQEKGKCIQRFMNILPNYTEEFVTYNVPGTAPDYVKEAVRTTYFVKDYLEKDKNTFVFEEPPAKSEGN